MPAGVIASKYTGVSTLHKVSAASHHYGRLVVGAWWGLGRFFLAYSLLACRPLSSAVRMDLSGSGRDYVHFPVRCPRGGGVASSALPSAQAYPTKMYVLRTREITKERRPNEHGRQERETKEQPQPTLLLSCGRHEVRRGEEELWLPPGARLLSLAHRVLLGRLSPSHICGREED